MGTMFMAIIIDMNTITANGAEPHPLRHEKIRTPYTHCPDVHHRRDVLRPGHLRLKLSEHMRTI